MKRAAIIAILALAACDSGPRPEPLVVYAYGNESTARTKVFAAFTDATGIPVTFRYGDSKQLTNNVINDQGSPPADLLLTSNVADIWRAADHGALRPIHAEALAIVPDAFKDPDGSWVAFDVYRAVIGQTTRIKDGRADDYADLSHPQVQGEVCLSSSRLPINRAVIALLMADKGKKEAERIVRGWVRNLALPPFETEAKLVAALQSGTCGYGVFSDTLSSEGITRIGPSPLYYNVAGLGVARHARYPEAAQTLVAWLIKRGTMAEHDHAGHDSAEVGWRDEDAALLAERAAYR